MASDWSQLFFRGEPIETSDGKKLHTLADGRDYILALSKSEQAKPHWQSAAQALLKQAENGQAFELFTNTAMKTALNGGPAPFVPKIKPKLKISKRLDKPKGRPTPKR